MNEDDLLKNKTEKASSPENNEQQEQKAESVEDLADRSCSEIDQEVKEFESESEESFEGANKTIGLDEATVAEIATNDGVEGELSVINAEVEALADTSKQEIKKTPDFSKSLEVEIGSQGSFEELLTYIKQVGDIKAADGHVYKSQDMLNIIAGVKDGQMEIDRVTRSYGIRAKVYELLNLQPVKIEEVKQEKVGTDPERQVKLKNLKGLKETLEDYNRQNERASNNPDKEAFVNTKSVEEQIKLLEAELQVKTTMESPQSEKVTTDTESQEGVEQMLSKRILNQIGTLCVLDNLYKDGKVDLQFYKNSLKFSAVAEDMRDLQKTVGNIEKVDEIMEGIYQELEVKYPDKSLLIRSNPKFYKVDNNINPVINETPEPSIEINDINDAVETEASENGVEGQEKEKPFDVDLSPEQSKHFVEMIGGVGMNLKTILDFKKDPVETLLLMDEMTGKLEKERANKFKEVYSFIKQGITGGLESKKFKSILTANNLTFRYVNQYKHSQYTLDGIVKESAKSGGKNPNEKLNGICVSDGLGYVEDKVTGSYKNDNELIGTAIFIYDKDLLTNMSKDETDTNLEFYGMKPVDGKKLSDALLGSIVLRR